MLGSFRGRVSCWACRLVFGLGMRYIVGGWIELWQGFDLGCGLEFQDECLVLDQPL